LFPPPAQTLIVLASIGYPLALQLLTGLKFFGILSFQAQLTLQQSQYLVVLPLPDLDY